MQNHVNMPEQGEEERDVCVGQEAEVRLEEERDLARGWEGVESMQVSMTKMHGTSVLNVFVKFVTILKEWTLIKN